MRIPENSLYDPSFEHDACGVGFVADIGGNQSHSVVATPGITSVPCSARIFFTLLTACS